MRVFILSILIVSLSVALLPIVSATHFVTVSDDFGNSVATQSNPLSICPKPLTPQDFVVKVKNSGTIVDTYTVDVNLPVNWELGEIKSGFSLEPGQTADINPFLISYIPSNTLPGNYEIDVVIKSARGDIETKTVYVEILACHAVSLSVTDDTRIVCEEDVIKETYQLVFKNTGKYDEVLDLSTTEGWAGLSTETLRIKAGETKNVDLVLIPTEGLSGIQNVGVKATSQTSYVDVSETVFLDIQSCFGATVTIDPSSKNICQGESTTYQLILRNTGKDDTFTLSAPSWIDLTTASVFLTEGEEARVDLTVTPTSMGVQTFEVTVDSSHINIFASGVVNSEECRAVTVFLFPDEKTTCSGTTVDYTISVKNTGRIADKFDITTTVGTPEVSSVELGPGESRNIGFFVDTKDLSGDVLIGVKAKSTNTVISDQASSLLTLENCYTAELNFVQDVQEVCPFFEASYMVVIKNTGKNSDTYTLNVDKHSETFTLDSGQIKQIEIPIFANVDSGDFSITAELSSDFVSLTDTSTLRVKTAEQCFSSEVVRASNGNIIVEEQKGLVVPIKVKNTGDQGNKFTITAEGPDWTYLRPTILSLESQDQENVYLYLIPPIGTPSGEYQITVVADSPQTTSRLILMIDVISKTAPLETVPEETTGVVIPDEEPIIVSPIETEVKLIDLIENDAQTEELGVDELALLLIYGEEHTLTIESATEDSVQILIQSDPILLDIDAGTSKKIDLDNDGFYDLLITYNGYVDGKADVTYEKINESVEVMEEADEVMDANDTSIEEIDEVMEENDTSVDEVMDEIVLEVNDSENDTVILNVSLVEDDELTGLTIGSTPFWKTAIVGAITLIIIVILLIRFSFLLKSDKQQPAKNNKNTTKRKK